MHVVACDIDHRPDPHDLRQSYNGYYPSLPSWRRGFDSLLTLEMRGPPLAGLFYLSRQKGVVSQFAEGEHVQYHSLRCGAARRTGASAVRQSRQRLLKSISLQGPHVPMRCDSEEERPWTTARFQRALQRHSLDSNGRSPYGRVNEHPGPERKRQDVVERRVDSLLSLPDHDARFDPECRFRRGRWLFRPDLVRSLLLFEQQQPFRQLQHIDRPEAVGARLVNARAP